MPVKNLALVVIVALPFIGGCGESNMTDADNLTVKLRTELGTTRIEEHWNETLVLVNFSGEEYGTLKAKLQAAFGGVEHVFSEDDGYEKLHCRLQALGPDTAPSKKHRWQVNVHAVDDEDALDDMGSYLAKELEVLVQPEDKFVVVIFDNGARYAY